MAKKKKDSSLERNLGFWDILFFGIGSVVGAGIYAIIGKAGGMAGNMLWLSFVLAAVVALLTGLSYAEFVSRFPDAGGSFEYIKRSFGPKTAYILSVFMLFTGIVAAAAIGISFADYLIRLWNIPTWVGSAGIIGLMGLVNALGVSESAKFNLIATLITLAGLGLVIAFALPEWGSVSYFESPPGGYTGILSGSALIFFSYIGFEDLVKMAEETKKPEINMPRGVLWSGLIVLALYLMIAISAVSVLDWQKLAESDGPLAEVISTAWGKTGATILVVVALFATSKTILSNILGGSRLLYDVARDSDANWLKHFTNVFKSTGTPVVAILIIAAIAIGISLIGDLKVVASISNIFIFIVFLSVNIALLYFRYSNPEAEDPRFRVRGTIGKFPVPTLLATLLTFILFGFNIYNLL
jgi:amino acid transporter